MQPRDRASPPRSGVLRHALARVAGDGGAFFGPHPCVPYAAIDAGTCLGGHLPQLADRAVLIRTREQLPTALALVELDGIARRMVLCPPDLPVEDVAMILTAANIEAVVCDPESSEEHLYGGRLVVKVSQTVTPVAAAITGNRATEWLLLTSGTTGSPKLAQHTVHSLTGAIKPAAATATPTVWATFYDIRRYGGLQIFLRAVLGGASLVLSNAGEPIGSHVSRLAQAGVTHISGTPSHWRRLLMSGHARNFAPGYVRLSGEIADQAVLDQLQATYPHARVGHAYASTEAGVGFEVNDGLEGFPASLMDASSGEVQLRLKDGALCIRSARTASDFVGRSDLAVADAEGFVDTGDILELRGDRYFFVGRRGGIVNVGGEKVHPEEVEAVINRHPAVRMSLVKARKNPISGAVVVAEVVLEQPLTQGAASLAPQAVEAEILALCRSSLARHKVPVLLRFVRSLNVTAAGKLARHA